MTSAEAVILAAFGAHFFKEVSQSQLESAAKSLLPLKTVSQKGDKRDYIMPLAEAFLKKGIIKVVGRSNLKNLARGDLKKVGPF